MRLLQQSRLTRQVFVGTGAAWSFSIPWGERRFEEIGRHTGVTSSMTMRIILKKLRQHWQQ